MFSRTFVEQLVYVAALGSGMKRNAMWHVPHSYGVAAFDFAMVSCCDQFVVSPTHARGGTLDLLMTDFPDLIRVAVVAPIGNSDHSSLSALISMAQAVPNLCVSRKVFLKHQVNWNTVCGAIHYLPWSNIWVADNPVEVLN